MTHYFYSTPERQAMLRRYLASEKSQSPIAALEVATGMTAAAFTAELRKYIGRGSISFRRMTRPASAARPAVAVTRLPASADDLLIHSAALRHGLATEHAPARLAQIRAAAAKHPSDPFARRTLAHAETLYGDRAVALRLLEALQAEAPGDAELMYLRGRLHLANAEEGDAWERESRLAQTWFGRAHRADPNHFQTLYRYAQSQRQGSAAVSENTMNVLLLAQQLAPQVIEIRLNAAALLLARGDVELAEFMLAPLMTDPHDRSLAQEARRMIDEARKRQPNGEQAERAAPAAK